MIIKFFLLLLLSSLLSASLACEIHLPSHLILFSVNTDVSQSFQSSGCSDELVKEVSTILNSVEGKITSFQFEEILKTKNLVAHIEPKLINVQYLKQLVRDQLLLPPGVQLRSAEAIHAQNFLSLSPGDVVNIECTGCLFGAQQPINVNIIGFDGSHKSLPVKADFKKMVRAYRLRASHAAFSTLDASSLQEEYIESIPFTDLITDLEKLKFYKLNKPIRAGEVLRLSDLNAINLVRAGFNTEVIIENELVKIKTHGISRSNGSLGDFVEVFHPQKNKKYQGRVIDINKVSVEL